MQVFLPQEIGFCFGVKRALKLVLNEIKRSGKTYTLGDLIHNSQVVENLKRKGIESIENLSQIKEGTLVIRSHGADPSIIEEAKKKKNKSTERYLSLCGRGTKYSKISFPKILSNSYCRQQYSS